MISRSFASRMPVERRRTARTSATSGEARQARSTPPPASPVAPKRRILRANGPVGCGQPLVDDRKRFGELRLRDAQRRIREEAIPSHERVEALFAEELAERLHFR